LKEAGGGWVTLRALDPETAESIDALNDAVNSSYGDIHNWWAERIDPGGIGAVSRAEFVADVVRDLNLTNEVGLLVFKVLDTAGTGWLAVTETSYLEAFSQGEIERGQSTGGYNDTLPARSPKKPAENFKLPWETSTSQPSATLLPPSHQGSPGHPPLWSPEKSTRKTQHRAFANTHSMKHRWLQDAVLERCRHSSQAQVLSTQKSMRDVLRSTPEKDIFRSTNDFYRSNSDLGDWGLGTAGSTEASPKAGGG